MIVGIIIGVIAYGFIVALLIGISMDAKRGDQTFSAERSLAKAEHELKQGVAKLKAEAPEIGQASVGEFGYPMPSTTQPASVASVSGYVNPDSAYANKRFERETWTPDGESFGMGV